MSANMKDVAEEAEVSITTVSAVINDSRYVSPELTEKVQDAIEKLNYHPDHLGRGLRKGQSKMVGLVVSDITNPFFPRVARGVEDYLHENGYGLILCNTDEEPNEEDQYLSFLRSQRIDGLVIAATSEGKKNIEKLKGDIPLVLIDRIIENLDIPHVVSDNRKGGYQATQYLIELGHENIGFVAGIPGIRSTDDRLEGYRSAMVENQLPVKESFIVMGNSRAEDSYEAAKKLLNENSDITAIFAANNLITIGVLKYLKKSGVSCPESLSLVCFDDPIWGAALDRNITVISQQPYEMGYRAGQILLGEISEEGSPLDRKVTLPAELEVRGTTGPPPENN